MIVVTGSFRLPAEQVVQALPAMERVIMASREEPGCLAYSYSEDVLDPGLFIVSEMWVNGDVLAQHFQMPHMDAWKQEREAFGMTDRSVTMHAVKHSTDL